VNSSDGVHELCASSRLQDVRLRARIERPVNIFIAAVNRQHDEAAVHELVSYRTHRVDAIHDRHREVHERDIGAVEPEESKSLLAARRLGDH
jgi:hypothetical protein